MFYYARQYDHAIEQLQKTLEMDPSFIQAHIALGRTYAAKTMYNEAIEEMQKAIDISGGGDPWILAELGSIYALSGKRDEAKKVLDELHELSKQRYISPNLIALIYGGLGQKDQAFEWLEKAFSERDSQLGYLKVEPQFDSLRSDPRFKALLKKMKLE